MYVYLYIHRLNLGALFLHIFWLTEKVLTKTQSLDANKTRTAKMIYLVNRSALLYGCEGWTVGNKRRD